MAAPLPEILAAMSAAANQPFREAYQAYLDKFSDRCLDELKLESPTLADDPLMLLRTIGQLAQRQADPSGLSPSRLVAAQILPASQSLPRLQMQWGQSPRRCPKPAGSAPKSGSTRRWADARCAG